MRSMPLQPSSKAPSIPVPLPENPANPLPEFLPFGEDALAQAQRRHLPVFLIIGELPPELDDPALSAHLAERTIPARLAPGEREDVQLLCQRCAALTSGEGALPLCALLLPDGRPFLAAPMPPRGFALDPARLFVWLTSADRRLAQNPQGIVRTAGDVLRSFSASALSRPFTPGDAAHDMMRALTGLYSMNRVGGAPMVCTLRFLARSAERGDSAAKRMLEKAMDALLSSALYDPLDGLFFRATLTDDGRVFVPEKPLAENALLALTLLDAGRRDEAARTLDGILHGFSLSGGGFSPCLLGRRETYAFSAEQLASALGNEDGMRAARMLHLLRRETPAEPYVAPSRFSPPLDKAERMRPADPPPLCPRLPEQPSPEDIAFLRRILPDLSRLRAVRAPEKAMPLLLTRDCAIAAVCLAIAGKRMGEARYLRAADQAVSRLLSLPHAPGALTGLPPACIPSGALTARATLGSCAGLSLALLTLGGAHEAAGVSLASSALHAFLLPSGLPMLTPADAQGALPRLPAVYDDGLPSPAALLVQALRLAHAARPDAGFDRAISDIWNASAPIVRAEGLACAALVDAMKG